MPPFYQQMYAAWDGIVERLYKANPGKELYIDSAKSCEVDGVGLAIEFICQYMLADDDEQWLDIVLYDLVAMIEVGRQLNTRN